MKILTRQASVIEPSTGDTKVVSEQFASAASNCIVSSGRGCPSPTTTAEWVTGVGSLGKDIHQVEATLHGDAVAWL